MKIRQNLLFLSTAMLLSACGHYSEDLAAMDKKFEKAPSQSYAYNNDQSLNAILPAAGGEMSAVSFNEALAREYHELAKTEQAAMDYQSAKLFTEKAKAAFKGKQVVPAAASTPQGQARRTELVNALATQMTPENYTSLARAQAQYDSWQEQKTEAHQAEEINRCREGFEQAMAAVVSPFTETRSYAVMFEPGQSTVSAEAQNTLNEIAAFISEQGYSSYQLTLSGAPEQVVAVQEKLQQMNFPDHKVLAGADPTAQNAVQINLRYAVSQQESGSDI